MTALPEVIRSAFDAGSDPPSRVVDCRCEECLELEGEFAGRDWRTLTVNELSPQARQISLLTPEAFRYYLPAYLLASLGEQPEAWDICAATVFLLQGPKDRRLQPWFESRFDGFSRSQVEAITLFLEHVTFTDESLASEAAMAHESVWEPLLRHRAV